MSAETNLVALLRSKGRAIPIVAMICRQTSEVILETVAELKTKHVAGETLPERSEIASLSAALRERVLSRCTGRMIAAPVCGTVLDEIWFGLDLGGAFWTDVAEMIVDEVQVQCSIATSYAKTSFSTGCLARVRSTCLSSRFESSATVAALLFLSLAVQFDRVN